MPVVSLKTAQMGAGVCPGRAVPGVVALSPCGRASPASLPPGVRSAPAPCSALGGSAEPSAWLGKQRMVSSALLVLPRLFRAIFG